MSALTISSISVRQDQFNRYCLNDLHKASGEEKRHQPSNFLAIQQTKELILELESYVPGISGAKIQAVETVKGKGKQQGTYAVKELVYAYAMWISAKFHITVIRAYDAMVTDERVEPQKTLPRGLTPCQQDTVIELIEKRSRELPMPHQYDGAKFKILRDIMKEFSVVTYDEVESEKFIDLVSFVAKIPLEGEFLGKESLGRSHDERVYLRISREQRKELAQAIKKAFYGMPKGADHLANRIRVECRLHSLDDLPMDQFDNVMDAVSKVEDMNTDFIRMMNEIRDEYIEKFIEGGAPWTIEVTRRWKQKFTAEMPYRPDWLSLRLSLS